MSCFTLTIALKGTFTMAWIKCPALHFLFAKMPHLDDLLQTEKNIS
jgi:hypothetical protein